MRARFFPTCTGLLTALSLVLGCDPSWASLELAGRVRSESGEPVTKATVFIYTAKPRTGTSPFCPSCYPDCGKRQATGKEGRFLISGLSDSLLFRLLVVAPGWEPTFVESVDPVAGPVEIALARRPKTKLDPHRGMNGRVLDPRGRPVVGATLEPFGYQRDLGEGRYMMRFGPAPGTDPLGITDERGRFTLALGDSGVRWFVRVRARDLAPRRLHQAASGRPLTVRMGHGATVSGRIVREGRTLPGVVVGLAQADRGAQFRAYGHEEIATDERGVFTFVNVTPEEDYLVHGKMESLRDLGALDTVRVRVGPEGSLVRVPDLVVGTGHRIAGRVTLAGGHPVPPGTRLLLALDPAPDTQSLLLDAEGRFEAHGVPPGRVTLLVGLRGYHIGKESSGYSQARGRPGCELAVDGDMEDLRIVLKPGEPQPVPVRGPAPGKTP